MPNPYYNPSSGMPPHLSPVPSSSKRQVGPSESDIRKRLTLEEEKDGLAFAIADGDDAFTRTKYMLFALNLEDQQ